MRHRPSSSILALASLAMYSGLVNTASADLVVYSDRASFETATTDRNLVDFEEIAPTGEFVEFDPPSGLVIADANFVSENLDVTSATYYESHMMPPYNLGSGDFLQAFGEAPASLIITLSGGFTAIGFDLETFDVGASALSIVLNGDPARAFYATAPFTAPAFVGVTSTEVIRTIAITITVGDDARVINLDNFTYATARPVPEPASLAMLAPGAIVICARSHKRSRRREASA